jgi:thioredoxin-dependent peroxiredoxin
MEIGSEAPLFCLPNRASKQECLTDFAGKWVVLYFYPKITQVAVRERR